MQPPETGLIDAFLQEEDLPPAFSETIERWYRPLAGRLLEMQKNQPGPLIVGINGAQGTGKSTLARFLTLMLNQQHLRVANLSLDDFYLDSDRRRQLAATVHPLLATRGVPGTHDMQLAEQVLERLGDPHGSGQLQLPRFDKAIDEPRPLEEWESVVLPVHVVLLEGWFMGLKPQSPDSLDTPINALETEEDGDGTWRHYVNQRLAAYQALFEQVHYLIMLRAPSFDCIYQWRTLQEQKLAARAGTEGNKVMDQAALDRFIQHFERLTRHCLASLPAEADLVLSLDADHQITGSRPPLH